MKYLSAKIKDAMANCNQQKIYELRIRADKPIMVNYGGTFCYLSQNGITMCRKNALIASKNDVDSIVMRASEYSIYSVSDQISKGFITTRQGERIGLAGECVQENGKILTIQKFTSVNVRFPHEVIGCADAIFPFVTDGGRVYNTLILSPPGMGKTTLLRDLCRRVSDDLFINLLIADERGELSGGNGALCLGEKTDVLSMGIKNHAFSAGLRALRPDVIATDELFGEDDANAVCQISACGVKILATRHACSVNDVIRSKDVAKLYDLKIFERYVVLSDSTVGRVAAILDKNLQTVYSVS